MFLYKLYQSKKINRQFRPSKWVKQNIYQYAQLTILKAAGLELQDHTTATKKDKVVFYLCFAVRSILFLFSSRKHKLPRTKKRRAVNNACKPKYEKKNLIIKSSPLAQIFILYYSCLISLRVNFTILILFSLFSLWHNSENKIMLNSVPEERTDKQFNKQINAKNKIKQLWRLM